MGRHGSAERGPRLAGDGPGPIRLRGGPELAGGGGYSGGFDRFSRRSRDPQEPLPARAPARSPQPQTAHSSPDGCLIFFFFFGCPQPPKTSPQPPTWGSKPRSGSPRPPAAAAGRQSGTLLRICLATEPRQRVCEDLLQS